MAHDLVIRNGRVVDGTGAPARSADVAIDDGRITAVGQVDEGGTQELDADGAVVAPGWVDVHSHYDGQATWDEELAPSSWHGVTTLVMGNCGVGFAPAQPDRHDWLIGLMEGVEDIPGTALAEGITWEWESFPEYLDALDRKRWTTDLGAQIAHGAVRAYVMGERGARNEPATAADIEAMAAIVREAIQAGALGFSTSRTIAHRAIDGEPVPGTYAAEDELFGIGRVLGELGTGVFELAPTGVAGEDIVAPMVEVAWMRKLADAIGRPVTFAMLQVDTAPELWREMLDESAAALASAGLVHAQSLAEKPDTPPPKAERQAPAVEKHLKTFDTLDFDGRYASGALTMNLYDWFMQGFLDAHDWGNINNPNDAAILNHPLVIDYNAPARNGFKHTARFMGNLFWRASVQAAASRVAGT